MTEEDNGLQTQRQRTSIAALDLPIEYAGLAQAITKSQSTPLNNAKNNKGHIVIDIESEGNDGNESKEELPQNVVLHRAHSLDSGKEKIVSVPTIEEILSSNAMTEEVVVPSRDVLLKMPFYSTPLTIESTNNAFRDFMVRLNEMGFVEEAEAALVATNAESVEAAVDFIMSNPLLSFHRFVPNEEEEQGEALCAACGLRKSDHVIDEIGIKIMKESENELYGDLNGRISMSMATRKQRDLLQQSIENRIKSISGDVGLELDKDDDRKKKKTDEQKEEKESDQEISGPTERCLICFEDRPLDLFYRAICGHNYCKICLQNHYRVKTNDGDVLKLSCIDPKCKRLIEEDEILKFLIDDDLRKKFIKFRQSKLLMLNPNARFCCKPDCEGTMIGSRFNRKLVCPICSTAICFNCSQPWHGYFVGCNQNIDIGYAKWALNKDVQKCPKCRMGIEKDDGCNHMTCSSCKYEFCWICKGPYNDYHYEWWNIFGCPGAQFTPRFCRCPICFPRWLNRILIILCFLGVVVPLVFTAGVCWLLIVCLIFCVRCDFKCDDMDICDCF